MRQVLGEKRKERFKSALMRRNQAGILEEGEKREINILTVAMKVKWLIAKCK